MARWFITVLYAPFVAMACSNKNCERQAAAAAADYAAPKRDLWITSEAFGGRRAPPSDPRRIGGLSRARRCMPIASDGHACGRSLECLVALSSFRLSAMIIFNIRINNFMNVNNSLLAFHWSVLVEWEHGSGGMLCMLLWPAVCVRRREYSTCAVRIAVTVRTDANDTETRQDWLEFTESETERERERERQKEGWQ